MGFDLISHLPRPYTPTLRPRTPAFLFPSRYSQTLPENSFLDKRVNPAEIDQFTKIQTSPGQTDEVNPEADDYFFRTLFSDSPSATGGEPPLKRQKTAESSTEDASFMHAAQARKPIPIQAIEQLAMENFRPVPSYPPQYSTDAPPIAHTHNPVNPFKKRESKGFALDTQPVNQAIQDKLNQIQKNAQERRAKTIGYLQEMIAAEQNKSQYSGPTLSAIVNTFKLIQGTLNGWKSKIKNYPEKNPEDFMSLKHFYSEADSDWICQTMNQHGLSRADQIALTSIPLRKVTPRRSRFTYTPEQKETALALLSKGESVKKISKFTNIKENTLEAWAIQVKSGVPFEQIGNDQQMQISEAQKKQAAKSYLQAMRATGRDHRESQIKAAECSGINLNTLRAKWNNGQFKSYIAEAKRSLQQNHG